MFRELVALAILTLIFCSMLHARDVKIQKYQQRIKLYEIQNAEFHKVPNWLIDSYNKCSNQNDVPQVWLKDCIACEIMK